MEVVVLVERWHRVVELVLVAVDSWVSQALPELQRALEEMVVRVNPAAASAMAVCQVAAAVAAAT